MRLKDKVSLITGAASGMGRATAMLFAREGSKVVATDVDEAGGQKTIDLIHEMGADAVFVKADVSREADARNMVEQTVARYGRLDVLFNNAGVAQGVELTEMTEQEWDRVVDIDLKGVFLGCKHGIREMLKTGGGAIISTASISGIIGQNYLGAYNAAKAGVINLTRHIAFEYGPRGIRANAICPGAVDTPMLKGAFEADAAPILHYFRHTAPLRRIGQPEDIAKAALFLASDDSSFITGHALVVDGGLTVGSFADPLRLRAMAEDILKK
ncbi:MAG: SDR family NAD(P)-dependent oxidoreductase [Candidatus Binatia bacterium]